jgi:hypothetical protein
MAQKMYARLSDSVQSESDLMSAPLSCRKEAAQRVSSQKTHLGLNRARTQKNARVVEYVRLQAFVGLCEFAFVCKFACVCRFA